MALISFRHALAVAGIALCALSAGCGLTQEITHNRYVGDKDTMLYHKEKCDAVKKIHPLKVAAFPYNAAARYEGYRPCDKCNPER